MSQGSGAALVVLSRGRARAGGLFAVQDRRATSTHRGPHLGEGAADVHALRAEPGFSVDGGQPRCVSHFCTIVFYGPSLILGAVPERGVHRRGRHAPSNIATSRRCHIGAVVSSPVAMHRPPGDARIVAADPTTLTARLRQSPQITNPAARGRTPVLVVESHLLGYDQLDAIRLLTNHDLDSSSPFA